MHLLLLLCLLLSARAEALHAAPRAGAARQRQRHRWRRQRRRRRHRWRWRQQRRRGGGCVAAGVGRALCCTSIAPMPVRPNAHETRCAQTHVLAFSMLRLSLSLRLGLSCVQVPVVFFSLLRKGTPDRDRSEAKLAEAFDFVSDMQCASQQHGCIAVVMLLRCIALALHARAFCTTCASSLRASWRPRPHPAALCRLASASPLRSWPGSCAACTSCPCPTWRWTGTRWTRSWAARRWWRRFGRSWARCCLARCARLSAPRLPLPRVLACAIPRPPARHRAGTRSHQPLQLLASCMRLPAAHMLNPCKCCCDCRCRSPAAPQGFALGTLSKVGPDHTDGDGLELGAAGAWAPDTRACALHCCDAASCTAR